MIFKFVNYFINDAALISDKGEINSHRRQYAAKESDEFDEVQKPPRD